ncbi:MAG: PadR family transcriptional regulator [Coriobacteriia bacterium]|nr:PadR family transcriptional regulator [Coriobacteriia bacterium]MCL2537315.1 PadR family transcriptional regulator [Coriobacteriia bacterium]
MFQLGSSLLDGCVLAVLAREDAYGYNLTQDIKEVISVSESTLYPVLRRLQKDEMLTTYDQPHSGRNRRYYRITDAGRERLGQTQTAWTDFKTDVDTLLIEGGKKADSSDIIKANNTEVDADIQKGGDST